MWRYIKMYVPAALSIASDYWRVSVVGIFASRIGNDELAVFSAGYRIMWICMIFSSSIASASSIKIGKYLGESKAVLARRVPIAGALVASFFMTITFLAVSF